MMYPLVLDLAAAGIAVAVACRVLGFSEQGFYKWRANPVSDRDWEEAHLINAAIDAHADDPEFGHRLIADELIAAGHQVSERRIWRLCSQQGLFSAATQRKRKHGKKPGPPVHDDLLRRDFTAQAPNTVWLTDIERHEALLNRAGVRDPHRCAVVAAW